MPVTRDADFPAEAAQLMQAMNHCANGHDMRVVIEAAANMFSASLHSYARAKGMSRKEAKSLAEQACSGVMRSVEENLDRQRKASDIEVKLQ